MAPKLFCKVFLAILGAYAKASQSNLTKGQVNFVYRFFRILMATIKKGFDKMHTTIKIGDRK